MESERFDHMVSVVEAAVHGSLYPDAQTTAVSPRLPLRVVVYLPSVHAVAPAVLPPYACDPGACQPGGAEGRVAVFPTATGQSPLRVTDGGGEGADKSVLPLQCRGSRLPGPPQLPHER